MGKGKGGGSRSGESGAGMENKGPLAKAGFPNSNGQNWK